MQPSQRALERPLTGFGINPEPFQALPRYKPIITEYLHTIYTANQGPRPEPDHRTNVSFRLLSQQQATTTEQRIVGDHRTVRYHIRSPYGT
jgi:predicted SAM-dependent methyltransferase